MLLRQKLWRLITFRWLVEWWKGPRTVALEHVTEKHAKCKTTLETVQGKIIELERSIQTLEEAVAKSERPDRAKLYELRAKRGDRAQLGKREKVLTDRLGQLSEILHRFEIDDDYMPLSDADQQVITSVSERLAKQADSAQTDSEILEDTGESIADAINAPGLDAELLALEREGKNKHAPQKAAAEPEPAPAGRIVQLFPDKEKEAAPAAKEKPDAKPREGDPGWVRHAAAAREATRGGEPAGGTYEVHDGDDDGPEPRTAELA